MALELSADRSMQLTAVFAGSTVSGRPILDSVSDITSHHSDKGLIYATSLQLGSNGARQQHHTEVESVFSSSSTRLLLAYKGHGESQIRCDEPNISDAVPLQNIDE